MVVCTAGEVVVRTVVIADEDEVVEGVAEVDELDMTPVEDRVELVDVLALGEEVPTVVGAATEVEVELPVAELVEVPIVMPEEEEVDDDCMAEEVLRVVVLVTGGSVGATDEEEAVVTVPTGVVEVCGCVELEEVEVRVETEEIWDVLLLVGLVTVDEELCTTLELEVVPTVAVPRTPVEVDTDDGADVVDERRVVLVLVETTTEVLVALTLLEVEVVVP